MNFSLDIHALQNSSHAAIRTASNIKQEKSIVTDNVL